jgi:RimJ/RimL family protein N-acetyltransferase/ubiquinone/menaquinone biosynthesis C-methylase UbiE
MIIVETDRALVRHWIPDDLPAFQQLATDVRVLRYIGDGQPWSDERVRRFVDGGIKAQTSRGWALWPVVLKSQNRLVGICGFNAAFAPEVEIGWWLAPEQWGRGLATEVAGAVMEYGFGRLGLDRLISVAQPTNRASIRVMEKLGMTFDRAFTHKGIEVVAYEKTNPVAADMSAPSSPPSGNAPPSPGPFFQAVNAYQRTAAIRAGVELDLFTGIGEGKTTAKELSARSGASERGVRILCDALVSMGFLLKPGGRYALTPDSAAFLDKRSPAYAGGIIQFMLTPTLVDSFARATDAVRKGGTALPGRGTVDDEDPVWVDFAKAMGPVMAMPAELLAKLVMGDSATKPLGVLDIAAGHGLFGIAFANLNPNARVTALDWKSVVAVASENAKKAGVADRFDAIAGSAFDVDMRGPYDVVLLPNFLHHFDPPTCESVLRRVHSALAEGGRAIILEFVPDEDRVGPAESVMFALTMLATTPSGDAYTFAEYERMCRNAGFSRSELHQLPPTMERVVIAYR